MIKNYIKLILERLEDGVTNNIHSGSFSAAVEFEGILIKNNQIFTNNLHIYLRLGTNKRVLEDKNGVILIR